MRTSKLEHFLVFLCCTTHTEIHTHVRILLKIRFEKMHRLLSRWINFYCSTNNRKPFMSSEETSVLNIELTQLKRLHDPQFMNVGQL